MHIIIKAINTNGATNYSLCRSTEKNCKFNKESPFVILTFFLFYSYTLAETSKIEIS